MGKENFPVVHGFRLMNEIGGGGFSVVYRAVNFEEQITAACKVISLTRETTPAERESLEKEIKVQSGLKHPNVLEFMHGLIVEPPDELPRPKKRKRGSREASADDDNKEEGFYPAVYMVLELAGGGDLFDKIEPEKGVETDVAHHYFRQLALGLEYLHQNGVCHRDLKPENILLSSAGVLKISDFGLCGVFAVVNPNGKRRTRLLSERCGSYPYMAPELIGTEPYEAEPIDIWGIGVILYALLSGNTPWEKADRTSSEYTRYLAGEIFNLEPWCHFERDALGLITGMLTPDPTERMTIQDIFHHPWILRENELTQRGAVCVAEALTQNLRSTGALDIATPPSLAPLARTDRDGDQIMLTAMAYSQFTQTLMLFSQTAAGQRYTPGWTRFYANVPPSELQDLVLTALKARGVKHKILAESGTGRAVRQRIRIGGYDTRRLMYRGLIELEAFEAPSVGVRGGTFCVMTREKGNPISWRQIWKNLIISPSVEPVVLRKPERA